MLEKETEVSAEIYRLQLQLMKLQSSNDVLIDVLQASLGFGGEKLEEELHRVRKKDLEDVIISDYVEYIIEYRRKRKKKVKMIEEKENNNGGGNGLLSWLPWELNQEELP